MANENISLVIAIIALIIAIFTLPIRFWTISSLQRKIFIAKLLHRKIIPRENPDIRYPLLAINEVMFQQMDGNDPRKELNGFYFLRKETIKDIGDFTLLPIQPLAQLFSKDPATKLLEHWLWVINTKKHKYICWGYRKLYNFYRNR